MKNIIVNIQIKKIKKGDKNCNIVCNFYKNEGSKFFIEDKKEIIDEGILGDKKTIKKKLIFFFGSFCFYDYDPSKNKKM